MANILLVGFKRPEAKKLRNQIDPIAFRLEADSATIILDVETRWCGSKKPAPYIVVQHSKAQMAEAIGVALHSALNLDTQIEVTHKYLASIPKPLQE